MPSVRKIRNEFAHSLHGLRFEDVRIRKLCVKLKSHFPPGEHTPTPRALYTNAVICVYAGLYYRPEWVSRQRQKKREWLDPDIRRWRSVANEKPPENMPVLAFGKRLRADDSSGGD